MDLEDFPRPEYSSINTNDEVIQNKRYWGMYVYLNLNGYVYFLYHYNVIIYFQSSSDVNYIKRLEQKKVL